MNNVSKIIFLLSICIILANSVSAAIDISYTFNQNYVNVLAFDCLNSDCSSVRPFSGAIIKGPIVSDGEVILRYPDLLASEFGYAEFFVSSGFRPLVGRHNWHTFGISGLTNTSQSANFSKMPNVCKAPVSNLNGINNAQPHLPLSIGTTAFLDALTSSAFRNTNSGVNYIPDELLQEFWGADTTVLLEILNGSSIIHSQQKNFTAQNNNAIISNSSMPINFTFIPQFNGNFTAKITSKVVDNQCFYSQDQFASSLITIASLGNQFYTILNNLSVNNIFPKAQDFIIVSFNKITNHNSSVLTPINSSVDFIVLKEGLQIISSLNNNLPSNPDAFNPVSHSFNFTPATAGNYTITIKARANSSLPTALPEIMGEQNMMLSVDSLPTQKYSLKFFIINSQNNASIPGASLNLVGVGALQANSSGEILFSNLTSQSYWYTSSAQNFSSLTDFVDVSSDTTKTVYLTPLLEEQTNSTQTNSTNSSNQELSALEITILPVNNTVLNHSFLSVNITTNISVSCKWDKFNVAPNSMQNNFSTLNGFFHTTNIANLLLGKNNIFVACGNQSGQNKISLSFFVQNILDNSTFDGANSINNSTVINSFVNQSTILHSTIETSQISNSSVISSSISNSTINNAIISNANVSQNSITNGEITINGLFYNASANGPANFSELIAFAPVANFIQSASTILKGNSVTFTSTSTDANIPGPLNDSLHFFWQFSDGTNSVSESVNKIFNNAGTFTINLTVKDKFNSSSSKTGTIIIENGALLGAGNSYSSKSAKTEHIATPIVFESKSQQHLYAPANNIQIQSADSAKKSTLPNKISSWQIGDKTMIGVLVFFAIILFCLCGYVSFLLAKQLLKSA